jgi:hypothetical protein
MQRIRQRVADRKVTRVIRQFLKAGVLSEEQLVRTPTGTPQGGVISPLLANIALSAIEEKYERWVNQRRKAQARRRSDGVAAGGSARRTDRKAGRAVYFPVRYADDFVVLVSGSRDDACAEKIALQEYLRKTLRLELSAEKTRVTALTEGFEFLGHRIRLRWDHRFGFTPRVEVPKAKAADLRHRVKQLTRNDRAHLSLSRQLQDLNPILRGWAYFYRYCTNASNVLHRLDWYVDDRLWRWMRKKYPKAGAHQIARHRTSRPSRARKTWRAGRDEQFIMGSLSVMRYRRGWMGKPDYAVALGEPDA